MPTSHRLSTDPQTDFDLIIIGAGINGAGVARDAALRGLRVLVIEKDDVASGTTSRSTRLIHGGLRYLEHGELFLVRESLREREVLLRIAPHLVRPLPLLVPIYQDNRRGKTTIRAGMFAYDLLSYDRSVPGHKMLSLAATLDLAPGLNAERLTGGALYYDAQVEFPERLVLENLLSAIEHGARLVTHAKIEDFVIDDGQISAVRYVERDNGELRTARAKFFINATGPWVDQLLKSTNTNNERLIGGTKGSHIVVPAFEGSPELAIYLEARRDRRPFFIIPWNGNYLIGTTDLRFDEPPDRVQISEGEVEYLLSETNNAFPTAKLTQDRISYSYAGVRPLPFSAKQNAKSTTRHHFIRKHRLRNLLSIVGGKLTTFRSLAEEVVDTVLTKLEKPSSKSLTSTELLPGAKRLSEARSTLENLTWINSAVKDRLLRIYGSRSLEVIELVSQDSGLAQSLGGGGATLAAEVVFSFENEYARSLIDCLFRRTMLGFGSNLGVREAEAAARVAQSYLGWGTARATSEVERYKQFVHCFRI